MSRLVRASAALMLVGAFAVPLPSASAAVRPAAPDGPPDFTLTILHANDPESQLLSASGQDDFGGAARFTTLLDRLRETEGDGAEAGADEARERGVVTVNSGDMYLPGPEFAASQEDGAPSYDAIAANHARYDAISMGNHEFDFGPDVYADFVDQLTGDTTVVAANVDVSAEPALAAQEAAGRIAPSTVVEVSGERVGIVGALYPPLATVTSPRGVVVEDLVVPVQAEVDRLTGEGVDKIIMISHLQNIAYEERVARELTGVDAIVAGGGHEVMAGPDDVLVPGDEVTAHPETGEPLAYPLVATAPDGTAVPIVTAGSNYKYVGRLVVNFDGGDLVSVSERSGPVRVSGAGADAVSPHPGVEAEVTGPVADHVAQLAETEVALSEVDLDGVQNPGVRTRETNLGNLVADGLLDTGRRNAGEYGVPEPQIGIQNGGGIRNASVLPAGPLSALDTYSVAPFANQVAVVPDLPRSQVKELLEQGVAAAPAASGAFMQVAGVNFAYDPARTAQAVDDAGTVTTPGERVRNVILHDGTVLVRDGEVVDGDPVTVVTNDFSARGGDMYPFRDAPFTVVGATYQVALERLLTDTLEGRVTAQAYPEGGSGRIVVGEEATVPDGGGTPTEPPVGPTAGPTDPAEPTDPPSAGPTAPGGGGPGDDKPGRPDGANGALPTTGSALFGLVAAAVIAVCAGGAALYLSRRRTGAGTASAGPES
ncbi:MULTISPECIES: bifunctional metallophosphatase/5'-nucleotidase [Nocardiopsidaceae]|uniref:5'-nucleotidase C-terminal domain-containing protein n=1 Tax=Streptomonospora nanhaiensis TaxID=1323731 RepID=A0ABY6YQU3_9ACTN|nr:5'-nucleotidase C-terminal domain-containing protein [Streptomonospora nanhaiensis]WAE74451.1 5'-nucleotidase C-terminal domain-containing protein [Streptomonospora nanhaiensis]